MLELILVRKVKSCDIVQCNISATYHQCVIFVSFSEAVVETDRVRGYFFENGFQVSPLKRNKNGTTRCTFITGKFSSNYN